MAPLTVSSASELLDWSRQWGNNETGGTDGASSGVHMLHCEDGILLPAWLPLENVTGGTVAFRGAVYIIILAYLFVGVAILADRFMASIEMITSKKKEVKLRDKNGQYRTVVVRVWNETVANLTLMALGCSAPEILLSSIEIIGKGFEAGELGPGSTVGSAAFNLFIIVATCNYAIPDGEVRRIKRVSVFLVTAAWSIFAYLWLYLITAVVSPGAVELWEALLTFAFFPMTVFSAYIADRHVHIYDYLSKTYRMGRNGVIVEMTTDEAEVAEKDILNGEERRSSCFKKFAEESENEEVREFEDHRRAFIILLKNLRRKYPNLNSNQLELMATKELLGRGSNSRAWATMASKMLTGRVHSEAQAANNSLDLTQLFQDFHSSPVSPMRNIDRQITKVFFSPGHYTVMESVGELNVTIVREDGDLSRELLVDYVTEDGEAVGGKDYESLQGTIQFAPGVTSKTITIRIIDDDLYEEDQHFYIRLFNLRSGKREEFLCGKGDISDDAYVTTAEVHSEPAPSYTTTVVEIEDSAPPRYSVTAREILSALRSNKNLRRPSWFHYDEDVPDGNCSEEDDVFFDAVSNLDATSMMSKDESSEGDVRVHDLNDDFVRQPDENRHTKEGEKHPSPPNTRAPSVASVPSVDPVDPGKSDLSAKRTARRSVEFSTGGPTFASQSALYTTGRDSSESSDDDDYPYNSRGRGVCSQLPEPPVWLRLVCPSLATVMILDDDHHGIFSLTERSVCLTETVGTFNAKIIRCGGSRGRVALSYRTEEGTAKAGEDYQHCEGVLLFENGETEKSVAVQIMSGSLYEKNVIFYLTIGDPKLIKDDSGTQNSYAIDLEELNIRAYSQLTEQQRVALKGRAQLGEVSTMNIRLKESKQFKNTVDKLLGRANATIKHSTASWRQQFIDAVHIEKDESEEEQDALRAAKRYTWKTYVSHFLVVFWRIAFAIIPPEGLGGGYPCFLTSVIGIGVITSLIGDVASHLGCTVGLKDSVTALAFVSLGTSLPDLFASKVSAVQDQHSDASISNVTGSNAVNVFLGIGVAWMLAAFHHTYHGTTFHVDAGTLAFSVTLYCCMAVFAVALLLVRRCEVVGGELGGPIKYKLPTTLVLVSFFFIYILLSSLEAYGYISGF